MIVVGSSVLIDVLAKRVNARTAWMLQRRYVERFAITTLILCEILQGLSTEEQVNAARRYLEQFEIFDAGTRDTAEAAARNYRSLRRKGITIRSTIDCLIATFCIQRGHSLLHNDRDFAAFEQHLGLSVVSPNDTFVQ